jgi:hypothetical protein
MEAREGVLCGAMNHPDFVVKIRFRFRYVAEDEQVGEIRYQLVKTWASNKPEFSAK